MTTHRITGQAQLDELSVEAFYASIPVQNASATRRGVNEGLVLDVPMKQPAGGWRLLSWLMPLSSTRRVLLDEPGTVLFRMCDGNVSTKRVIEQFAARYRLTFLESRAAVTVYMKKLLQRGALAVVLEGAA